MCGKKRVKGQDIDNSGVSGAARVGRVGGSLDFFLLSILSMAVFGGVHCQIGEIYICFVTRQLRANEQFWGVDKIFGNADAWFCGPGFHSCLTALGICTAATRR